MAVSFQVFARNFKRMSPDLSKAVIGAMRAHLLRSLKLAKTRYIVNGGGAPNRPPGPLINRTGNLRSNTTHTEPKKDRGGWSGALRNTARSRGGFAYGRRHELRSPESKRRPFLRPALEENIRGFEREVAVAYEVVARRLFR